MKNPLWTISSVVILVTLIVAGCAPQPTPAAAPTAGQPPTAVPAAPTQPPKPTATAVPPTVPPAPVQQQLVIAMDVDLTTFDPHHGFEESALLTFPAVYNALTELDPKVPGKINPLLAESWTISPDGLVYTFTLRKGVKFSTGREMTSDDVKFSLERLQNLKGNPAFLMDGVKTVEAPDPSTIKFTLAAADASFLSRTSAVYMAVIDSQAAKAQGATNATDADKTDKAQTWLDDNSLGTGPYILEKWDRNNEVRLTPNPNYWGTKPAFSSVVVKYVKDATTQSQMLQRGDIDIAMNLDPDTAKSLKGTAHVVIESGLSPTIIYQGMSTKKDVSAVTANQKFRQAVEYALDTNSLTANVLAGNAVTPPSVIPVGHLGYDSVQPIKRDLAKAKTLLAEAGYANGVKLTANYPNTTLFGVDFNVVMQKIQADLKEAGITLDLAPAELSVFLQGYRAGKDAFVIGYQTPDFPDPHANAWAFGGTDGIFAKRMAYVNPDNDKLLAQGVQATDPEARKAIYGKLLTAIQTDAVFMPLVQPKENVGLRDSIKGFVYNPVSKVLIRELSK
jgi:peptide/nickel transport system substrate-binding protein